MFRQQEITKNEEYFLSLTFTLQFCSCLSSFECNRKLKYCLTFRHIWVLDQIKQFFSCFLGNFMVWLIDGCQFHGSRLCIWAANPVSDCGCFGDFVKLPNGATFWKNVVITIGLILLLPRNPKVKGVYHAYTQWLAAVASSLYVLAVALYGLNIQPLVDFRSFPVGSRIVADTDDQDDSEYEFIYAKNGNEQTFTLDNLPDSTWSFVNRRQIGGEKERSDATELNIYDENGDNVTQEAIATEG